MITGLPTAETPFTKHSNGTIEFENSGDARALLNEALRVCMDGDLMPFEEGEVKYAPLLHTYQMSFGVEDMPRDFDADAVSIIYDREGFAAIKVDVGIFSVVMEVEYGEYNDEECDGYLNSGFWVYEKADEKLLEKLSRAFVFSHAKLVIENLSFGFSQVRNSDLADWCMDELAGIRDKLAAHLEEEGLSV